MTDELFPEILRGFVAESRSYLAGLRGLVERDGSPADLAEGYRLLHCVRGAASMLDLGEIAWTAGRGEAMLESASRGERPFDGEARADLAATLDAVALALGDLEAGLPLEPEEAMAAVAAVAAMELPLPVPILAAEDRAAPGDLVEGFLEEAEEHLATVGQALREMERDPSPTVTAAALREVRRRVHTLKGTASMVGFGEVSRLSHALEDALEQPDGRDRTTLVHEAVDLLEDLVRHPEGPETPEVAGRVDPLVARLRAGGAGIPVETADVPEPLTLSVLPQVSTQEQVRVPLERVDALVRVASELVVQRSVLERVHRELVRQAGELGLSLRRLSGISDRLETDYEASALTGSVPAASADTEFDELELDRYTGFHLLTRGLAETVSDVQAVGSELAGATSDFEGFLQRQQRLLRELQDDLLRLRAVPLATLAGRLHRTVRVTAERCGKRAGLAFEGESVELDKSLLEAVVDPLLHLVRNAVAHGIEPPEARRAAGKPEEGTIRVTTRYQGGQAVLEVADDGAGVDLAAVRAAAADLGLPGVDLTEEEALSLLFLPGFTTARAVSEVAGRGVGLDAVRAQVEALRGTVTPGSEPGRGARFTVRLPLSLAITRALLVEAAGAPFAVPAAAVSRVLRIEASDVRRDGEDTLVTLDGEDLPVRPLREILRLPRLQDTAGPQETRPLALVLDLGDHRAAVLVDRLTESRDVVVKPLGPLLRRVDGLAGATLLGDGSVVPILDPYTFPRWELGAARRPVTSPLAEAPGPLEVLIVDDSLSVRRVLSNLAGNAGWVPLTARDGLEALELLQSRRRLPGVILLDVEMPRMDGYELMATLRGLPLYAGVPIVMLTSRAGAKHREKALGLGASEYLAKPFQSEVLVHVVERLAVTGGRAAAGQAPS